MYGRQAYSTCITFGLLNIYRLCACCRLCKLNTGSRRLLFRTARAREMTNAVHTTATALLHSTRSCSRSG